MAFHLKQSRINCSNCGEFLIMVYRIVEGCKGEPYERELCMHCHKSDCIAIIRNASKIELLQVDDKGNIVDAPGGDIPEKESGFDELTIE